MNKKKLLALIAKKEARKAELNTNANASEDVKELRGINTELVSLNAEIVDLRSIVDAMPDDTDPATDPNTRSATTPVADPEPQQRSTLVPVGQLNPLSTYRMASTPAGQAQPQQRDTDFAAMEYDELLKAPDYRSAYLRGLQGRKLTEVERSAVAVEVEKRALTTGAASAGAAVPTTTFDKIIEKLRQTSVLFPLIMTTYIPGNVVLPVANARNAAIWSSEATDGALDNDDTVGDVSLSGFTLAKFAKVSIAAQVMTIDAFEAYIVNQIGEQLAIALENAILNGQGPTPTGGVKPQPSGILNNVAWDESNSLTYPNTLSGLDYDSFVDARALLGTVYRPGAVWVMNSAMEAKVMKIKSTTGKPIFSQDPQNGFIQKILNIPYIVDDYMSDNTVLLARLDYYYMNFSQSPVIEADRSAGFASSSVLYRGLLIADGKPALSEAFVSLTQAV